MREQRLTGSLIRGDQRAAVVAIRRLVEQAVLLCFHQRGLELLELYALFKQATVGDVTGSRPGMLDFKGRAKFDAWSKKKGTGKDAAMTAYVGVVDRLMKK